MSQELKEAYQSYLLRIYPPDAGGARRALLEAIPSRKRFGFSDMAELAAFLEERQENGRKGGRSYQGSGSREQGAVVRRSAYVEMDTR